MLSVQSKAETQNLQHLFIVRGSTKRTSDVADIPPRWGRVAPQIVRKKNRNFKIDAKFGGLWEKYFRGFGPGPANVLGVPTG